MAGSAMATLATILANYEANADYEEAGSVTKAQAFLTACRILLVKMPNRSSMRGGGAGSEMQMSVELLTAQITAAQNFIAANPTAAQQLANPDVLHPDFTNFRE